MLRNTFRAFSTSSRRLEARSVVGLGKTPAVVRPKNVKYDPKVFTQEAEASNGRPLPISVEANYYAAMRHEPKYGNKVAEIQLRSYDHETVDFYGDFIIRAAYYLNIPVSGTIPLPIRRERWTVIKAPFVHAKTKENYQRVTHKRLIRAFDATPEVIDLWVSFMRKHASIGLGIKVQTYQQQSLDFINELDQQIDAKELDDTLSYDAFSENSEVQKRVDELLKDPVFQKYLKNNDQPVETEPKAEPKAESKTENK